MGHEPTGEVKRLKWALIVTSESVRRGLRSDEVTPLVEEMLRNSGHSLVYRVVIGNDPAEIQYHVLRAIVEAGVDVVLVTGGTGPSPRDVSVDAVKRLASRELPGVGEAFRLVSYDEVGVRGFISSASAFIVHGRLVVVCPGSPTAVKTMLEKVLLPVVGHIVYLLRLR